MKYYLDITLLPDAEVKLDFLWQKLYQQIHLALVENKTDDNKSLVAISFPDYESKTYPLGKVLRLLADKESSLQELDLPKWLNRLTDYFSYTPINLVPNVEKYAIFKRKQFKSNIERLARRRAKRKNESYERCLTYYKSFESEETRLPYIHTQSLSSNEYFKLFIKKEVCQNHIHGSFDCYGLSKTATVPCFE